MLLKNINEATLGVELKRLARGNIENLALAVTRDEYQWCWNFIVKQDGWQNYIIKIQFFIEDWWHSREKVKEFAAEGKTFDAILFSHDWYDILFRSDILNLATDRKGIWNRKEG